MAAGQGFRSLGRILQKFIGIGDEYLAQGWRGIGVWFTGGTIKTVRPYGKVGDAVQQVLKTRYVYDRVGWTLFKRYGGIQLRVGQIYAGIRLPFWLINIPFRAGEIATDYSARRIA